MIWNFQRSFGGELWATVAELAQALRAWGHGVQFFASSMQGAILDASGKQADTATWGEALALMADEMLAQTTLEYGTASMDVHDLRELCGWLHSVC